MTCCTNDSWLWLGAGATIFVIVKGIQYAIQDVIRLTEVMVKDGDPNDSRNVGVEDSLNLDTLKTLSQHPNDKISNATISMIVMRFLRQPNAYEQLATDAMSSDKELPHKAHGAIMFLLNWPLPPDFEMPRAFTTLRRRALNLAPPATTNAATRRQHREAIVLHEGSGMLNESDILQSEREL